MKRFTIIFSILLVLGFAGTLAYVGMTPEFINPAEAVESGEDMDAPIWSMTMDEVLDELTSQGLIDRSEDQNLAAEGLCSEAVKVSSGAEFYWWDLESLDENSQEYISYKQMKEEGIIDIYGSGNIMSVVGNGPFGLLLSFYDGDANALDKAFRAVGQLGGGADRSGLVWTKTLDDLADYMAEQGVFDRNDHGMVCYDLETTGRVGYHFAGKINIEYYDLDNLDEVSRQQYDDFVKTGSTIYASGYVGYAWVNGPFVLEFYEWGSSPVPEEERPEIVEIFQAFCKE